MLFISPYLLLLKKNEVTNVSALGCVCRARECVCPSILPPRNRPVLRVLRYLARCASPPRLSRAPAPRRSAPPSTSLTAPASPSTSPLPHPRRSSLLLVALAAAPSSRPSDPPRPSRSTPRVDGSASPRAAPTRGAPPSPSPSPSSPRDHTPLLRRDATVLLCCKPLLTRRMCRAKCRRF